MTLTPAQTFLTLLALALGVALNRFLPFVLFPDRRQPPRMVLYLGQVLPAAAMALLVVYSLKDVQLLAAPFGVPELLGIVAVVLLHRWKGSMLLSIAGGTALYMLLVNLAFSS